MSHNQEKLTDTLEGHMAALDVSRWLSTLPNGTLLYLMSLMRPRADLPPHDLVKLIRTLMVADGVMRPGETRPALSFYLQRLGECASAEYAYRRDWVLLRRKLSLKYSPKEHCTATATGKLMLQALGPHTALTWSLN